MQPFQKVQPDLIKAKKVFTEMLSRMLSRPDEAREVMGRDNYTQDELVSELEAINEHNLKAPVFINDTYQVLVFDMKMPDNWPEMIQLSIRRLDRGAVKDWRELQEIKNQLVGPENEGMEMFPAESRLVDTANQYYLWVFKDPTTRFPFGFTHRHVSYDAASNTKQRPKGESV